MRRIGGQILSDPVNDIGLVHGKIVGYPKEQKQEDDPGIYRKRSEDPSKPVS